MADTVVDNNSFPTLYFPDGKTVPPVLTPDEVIRLLRLDIDGPTHPENTLEYYREKKLLKGVRLGQHLRYYLPDVIQFLENQADWTNRKDNVS